MKAISEVPDAVLRDRWSARFIDPGQVEMRCRICERVTNSTKDTKCPRGCEQAVRAELAKRKSAMTRARGRVTLFG